LKVKLILPALTEALSPHWRPIKYSLFPPLGLATLAGYLRDDDEVTIQDEHVEPLDLTDEPDDDETVFDRTVEWAIEQGIETATFHILTPYPGTALHQRLAAQKRITSANWDLYDTRHVVYHPAKMTAETLEQGYQRAYRDFYRWASILKGGSTKEDWAGRLRHIAYAGGWKKFEPMWDWVIRAKRVATFLPMLEAVLAGFGRHAVTTAQVDEVQVVGRDSLDRTKRQNEGSVPHWGHADRRKGVL
jgi:hypothetical protein